MKRHQSKRATSPTVAPDNDRGDIKLQKDWGRNLRDRRRTAGQQSARNTVREAKRKIVTKRSSSVTPPPSR
jgi:hypothetical protein